MARVLKVSDAASLALHAAAYLAKRPGERVSTGEIARALDGSEAHLAKVMRTLERAGLVTAKRGPSGGFVLARAASKITLKDVYEAVEGQIGGGACLLGRPVCEGGCILGDLVESVDAQVAARLARTRLSDVETSFGDASSGETSFGKTGFGKTGFADGARRSVDGRGAGRRGRPGESRSAARKGGGRWGARGRSSGSTRKGARAAGSASRTARKGRSRS